MRFGDKKRNAFTLVEVIISMALIVLVGGIVISLITFFNSYSAKNEAVSTRTRELTGLRMEIDKWFSYIDGKGIISIAADGNIVSCEGAYISVEDSYTYKFFYETNSACNNTLTFENIYAVKLVNEGTLVSESEPAERFTINMPVSKTYYICGVYCD